MKKALLVLFFAASLLSLKAQYTVIYENSFRNWMPGQGWVMINNDTIPQPLGIVNRNVTAGVPVPRVETLDNELGIIGGSRWLYTPDPKPGLCDKIMISPPLTLGNNPHALFYSLYKLGSSFSVWVVNDPNDTTVSGLTTQVLQCNTNGFNTINLFAWANSTIRLAFRLSGSDTYGLIDDLKGV